MLDAALKGCAPRNRSRPHGEQQEDAEPPAIAAWPTTAGAALRAQLRRQRELSRTECARPTPDGATERFLIFAVHSGWGIQRASVRKAALLAYVLNRTLVLPPVLKFMQVVVGNKPKLCHLLPHREGQRKLCARSAELWGELQATGRYTSPQDLYSYEPLRALGVPVVDYSTFVTLHPAEASAAAAAEGCSELKCDDTGSWGVHRWLRESEAHGRVFRLGSIAWLGVKGLMRRGAAVPSPPPPPPTSAEAPVRAAAWAAPRCLHAVRALTGALPLGASIRQLAKATAEGAAMGRGAYVAAHLRISDHLAGGTFARQGQKAITSDVGGAGQQQLSNLVHWLIGALGAAGVAPETPLFIGTNLHGGLGPALTLPGSEAPRRALEARGRWYDLWTLRVAKSAPFERALNRTRLEAEELRVQLDIALMASASAFFAPALRDAPGAGPEFRRSSFTREILRQWIVEH